MRTLLVGLFLVSSVVLAGPVDQPKALTALAQPGVVVIDVRSAEEVAQGQIEGALNLPVDMLTQHIAHIVPDTKTTVVLYCRSGRRSSQAQDALEALGYSNVINAGGYSQLSQALKAHSH